MEKKTYAASIAAVKGEGTWALTTGHMLLYCKAVSSDEALGYFHRKSKEEYPEKEGWTKHSILHSIVP